jgi:hypothetical protein
MVLQAKMYQKGGASSEAVESFFKSAESEITNPKLKKYLQRLLKKNSYNV